jgi:hypothetical protein
LGILWRIIFGRGTEERIDVVSSYEGVEQEGMK